MIAELFGNCDVRLIYYKLTDHIITM